MTQLSLTAPAAPAVSGPVLFIGVNCSVATALKDDPTIAKEQRYVASWGVAPIVPSVDYWETPDGQRRYLLTRPGMVKANLSSWRSTDPIGLLKEPIDECDRLCQREAIMRAAAVCPTIVAAWGGPYSPRAVQQIVEERAKAVVDMILAAGHTLHVLALSKDGIPRHVLYLKGDLRPIVWRMP